MRDEGLPIAYEVLEVNTPCYGTDDMVVGVVGRVIAEPELDIFHGLIVRTEFGDRFVAPELVRAIHERGVDLKIDSSETEALPPPD